MINLDDDKMCFVCGQENSIGLKLDFKTEGRKTTAVFTPRKEHQGYKNIVHGGILSTALDEAMVRLGYQIGLNTVSVHIEVDFRKPAYVNETLTLEGEIVKEEGKKVFAKSKLTNKEGVVVAEANGILVKLPTGQG